MKIDMADVPTSPAHRGQGRITGPDGLGYASTKRRLARRDADVLIADGCPLAIYVYGWGMFDWYDAESAPSKWAEIRAHGILYGTERQGTKLGLVPSIALWTADDGRELVYIEGQC